MTFYDENDKSDGRRPADGDELWEAAWPKAERERPPARRQAPQRPAPQPTSTTRVQARPQRVSAAEPEPPHPDQRRVYRANGTDDEDYEPRGRRSGSGREGRSGSAPGGRTMRRSPILAVVILIVIAAVIAFAGVEARHGALDGSTGDAGSFKLLPLTTTTTT